MVGGRSRFALTPGANGMLTSGLKDNVAVILQVGPLPWPKGPWWQDNGQVPASDDVLGCLDGPEGISTITETQEPSNEEMVHVGRQQSRP